MTDDYKLNVLKFMTGNLPEQSSTNEPQFENIQATTNNLYNQIKTYFSSRVAYVDFIPSKNNKNQNLEYSILACRGTLVGETDESGAFVILDKEYNIVDIITHYSDGSLVGILYCLNVDEKGNYYAVEYSNNGYKIILMNNLVLKPVGSNEYKAIKTETHLIPNQYTWESMLKVFKNESGNKYFVVANREDSNGIVGCELTTGDNDTWKYYTSSYEKLNAYAIFDNGYNVYWDSSGNLNFQLAVNDYGLIMLSKGSGTSMTSTRILRSEEPSIFTNNFIFYSNEIGYYATIEDLDTEQLYTIYKINLTNKSISKIYQKTEPIAYSLYNALWLFKNSNSIYFDRIAYNGVDYTLSFGLIHNVVSYEIDLGTFSASSFLEAFCYPNVVTDFNKNYIYIQNQNTLFLLNFLWNANDYNGTPYISNASLIPNKISILGENDDEIFNRNIYNLSNYSNQYIASVQVPNYFLNNEQLNITQLYSQANNLISSKEINTTKNIYEELNINFINKFKIIDGNIENISSASQLVNAMLNKNTNSKLSKIQINYQDNTTAIKNIDTKGLVYDDLTTTYKIVVYVDKLINTIDLISQDETILYKTIDCSTLQLNKYYLITQDIRIE